jgi:hypothetical protein
MSWRLSVRGVMFIAGSWIALFAISAYAPFLFLGSLNEVPIEFLTGILTFDGIVIAVITLSITSGERDEKLVAAVLSVPLILSSGADLYALLRPHLSSYLGLATFVGGYSLTVSIAYTALGVAMWLFWMIGEPILNELLTMDA